MESKTFTCDYFSAAKLRAKALAEGYADQSKRTRFARSFCARVLLAYWASLCQEHGCAWEVFSLPPLAGKTVPKAAASLAKEIGQSLSQLPTDEAGYLAGGLYTVLLPDTTRSDFGAYYTPPVLVHRLLDMATEAGFDWSSGRILDPACGGGAFLAPVASRLRRTLSGSAREILNSITDRLQGFELDPFAAWMSQIFLEAALLDLCVEAGQRLPSLVKVGDTLAMPVDCKSLFDLVIGNPPYRKIRLTEAQRTNFARSLFGHANLYGLFTDVAIRWTRPGGLVAYVTPTSFLGGQYFKALRGLLAAEAPPQAMDFVTDRHGVFEDVLQETMLAVYGREKSSEAVRVHFLQPSGRNVPIQVLEVGAFPLPETPEDPWLLPRDQEQAALFNNLLGKHRRLTDYGFGISTGQLVWNRHKQQLRTTSGENTLPLVWAESVTAKGFAFRTERNNHVPYIQIFPNQKHLVTCNECVLVQRTTAKEQDRRLIAAVLPKTFLSRHGGAVIENHLNMIRPLQGRPQIPLEVLAAFLNSRTVDLIFRSISGSVAVSAYEMNALPLPSPECFRELQGLVQRKASKARIEAAIARFYQEEM